MRAYRSKHLGTIHIHTQYVKARSEWVGYAVNNGQFLWSTQGSFSSSHEAMNASVAQIERHFETQLEEIR